MASTQKTISNKTQLKDTFPNENKTKKIIEDDDINEDSTLETEEKPNPKEEKTKAKPDQKIKREKREKKEKKQEKKSKVEPSKDTGDPDQLNDNEKKVFNFLFKVSHSYMQENRPHSAKSVSDMLAGTISINNCKKILESLEEKNLVQCKHYSSPIFLIKQSLLPEINEDLEKETELKLDASNKELNEVKLSNKNLKNELKNITQIKTEEEIDRELIKLAEKTKEITSKLQEYQSIEKVDERSMQEQNKIYDFNYKKAKQLKKIYLNILDFFLEKADTTKDELLEQLKIDKDEEIELINQLKYLL